MENADKRNVAAPVNKVNLNAKRVLGPVTCKTAKLNAANVPG